ncbi:Baculovirus F protein [Popillia japonica]|uniref:Baculovirus F protein n=1 Tax=Popillia japonica TaxID=7064 RepID=A0AAW1KL47_POPJA
MIACVFVLMMTGNVWTDQPKKPFSLQSLTGTSGVLIDRLGKLQITTDAWDVVAYVNLNDLNTKIDHLELAIAETENLSKSKQLSSCHMHVQLFEKMMKRQLQTVIGLLPSGKTFPIDVMTNVSAQILLEISSIKVLLKHQYLVCIVSIPLVEADAYQIFKLTSVPLPLQGTKYIKTLIKYPIIAINERFDLVISVSADEFRRFKRIGNKYFIGTSAQPISDEVTCETELIRPVPNLAPNCNIECDSSHISFNRETKYVGICIAGYFTSSFYHYVFGERFDNG